MIHRGAYTAEVFSFTLFALFSNKCSLRPPKYFEIVPNPTFDGKWTVLDLGPIPSWESRGMFYVIHCCVTQLMISICHHQRNSGSICLKSVCVFIFSAPWLTPCPSSLFCLSTPVLVTSSCVAICYTTLTDRLNIVLVFSELLLVLQNKSQEKIKRWNSAVQRFKFHSKCDFYAHLRQYIQFPMR